MNGLSLSITKASRLLVYFALIHGLLFCTIAQIEAQTTEIRVVNPETGNTSFLFFTNTTFKDSLFNVTLRVYDVNNLDSFQVFLTYDYALLEPTENVWIPTNDPEYVFVGRSSFPVWSFNYNHSLYGWSVGVFDVIISGTPFNGDGLLAIIEFRIIHEPTQGEGSVSASFGFHEESGLYDPTVTEIASTKIDGDYLYTWVPPPPDPFLEAKPRKYKTTTLETFNITIWINNTALEHNLANVTFTLSFNNTLLSVSQVNEGSFLSGVGITTFSYIIVGNNLTVTNALESPYVSFPEGDGEIAIITFQGIYQDAENRSSQLRIRDINLLNSTIHSIPIIPELTRHGSYEIKYAGSQISINADKTDVFIGSNLTISGSIIPVKQDVDVAIQYNRVGAIDWKNLSTVRTDTNGDYFLIWTANETGPFKFLSSWLGDPLNRGSQSEEIRIDVEPKESSTLTLNVNPQIMILGDEVTISGAITPARVDVSVTVRYRKTGETAWTTADIVTTDSQGGYSLTWTPTELATFQIMASWPGDVETTGADSSIETLQVVEELPVDYLPYIVAGIVLVIVVAAALFVYFKRR